MAGSKNSGNPYSMTVNLDKEIGEALNSIIAPKNYGKSTYLVKVFMETHKEDLIQFWEKQGKNGESTYAKWFAKWSMTEVQQAEKNHEKEKAEFESRKNKYLGLGCDAEEAQFLATTFSDKDPIEIVNARTEKLKAQSYASQTKVSSDKLQIKIEEKAEKEQQKAIEAEEVQDEKRLIELKEQIQQIEEKTQTSLVRLNNFVKRIKEERREPTGIELSEFNRLQEPFKPLIAEYNEICEKYGWAKMEEIKLL